MKKIKMQLLLMMLLGILSITAFAQTRQVTGTVTDAKTNAPLPLATVKVKGKNIKATSGQDGSFSLNLPSGDAVLQISYVGYALKEVIVAAGQTNLAVALEEGTAGNLNDVVVTALGVKRETKSIGYSAQKVTGNEVIKADPPNIAEGLMGKAAGLNITIPNGVEGSSSRIVIRGNNNMLGNNQPLIVVDGVMVDNEQILPQGQNLTTSALLGNGSATDLSQPPTDNGSFLNTINPDDIESFTILKGPTAAALYGARGANGVILIVTKKGTKLKGLGLSYNFSDRWNDPYRFVKMQHEYGAGMTTTLYSANPPFVTDGNGNDREFVENDQYGTYQNLPNTNTPFYNIIGFPGDGASWGPKMDGRPLVWWDGVTRPYTPNTNIFNSFYKTGQTSTHNVSFSGGGDAGTLRVSYTRTDNDAITYNSNFNQNVFNIGSSINVSQKVKAEVTASYTNINRLNAPNLYAENNSGSTTPTSGVGYITMYHLPQDYKPIERGLAANADGSKNTSSTSNQPYPSSSLGNYWWDLYNNNTTFTQNQLLGSIKLTADILPWLSATGHVGEDYLTNQFVTKDRPTDVTGLQGSYSNDLSTVSTQNIDGLLTLHKDGLFKDIDGSFSAGASYYHNSLYDIAAANPGPFAVPFLYNLYNYGPSTSITSLLPTENRLESEINSVYGIMNVSYKKYLFLEVSGRNDWSSTLPPAKLSFFYPSASLSYVFTDALKLGSASKWLSYGKLRIADAASANGYIPYQTIFNYTQSNIGGQSALTVPSLLPSVSIQPQQSRSFEIGTDLGFLNNRINFNFTYYNIYSFNQILPVNIATSSGADQLTINTGALRNRGIEFIINAKIINGKNFNWDITVNGAHNDNKVVSIAPGVTTIPVGSWFGGDGVNMNAHVGDDYGSIYGYDYTYASNGKRILNNVLDGGGNIIGQQYAPTANIVKIGNATPKLTGGVSNTLSYKNFSLYVLTDFKIGGQIWSGDYASMMGQGEAPETVWERDGHGLPYTFPDGTKSNSGVILDGVTLDPTGKPVTNTTVVNSWWKYAGNYQSWDNVAIVRTNSIFTDSWAKLRELSLTYRLSNTVVSKTKIFQNLSLSLIGRNLFYLFTTLPDKLNPEGLIGSTNVQGLQFGELPGVRSFGFSVKAGF